MTGKLQQPYRNQGGNSQILSYETGNEFLKVEFAETGAVFKFSYRTAGKRHVDEMKRLAQSGEGLDKYICENMRMLGQSS